MKPQKPALPDLLNWKFVLTLATTLRAIKPKIVKITSISITKIYKRKKDGIYDYRAVVKGRLKVGRKPNLKDASKVGRKLMLMDAAGEFEWTFEHREDCPWFPFGR